MWERKRFEAQALPHLPTVFRLARQLAGPTRADDLVQETYLRAWKHFDRFDGVNCRAWLCRILHNTWVSEWRRTRLELSIGDVDDLPAEPYYDWEGEVTGDVMSDDMDWALGQVPDALRFTVLLADVEELTYQEIAAAMECPIGTVMSRLNRGRRQLGRLLEGRRARSHAASASGRRGTS